MLLFAFLIGFFAGLRSLTAPAATAWAAYLGWLKLERPLALIGSLPALAIFTLLAVFELVADKLPQIPSRTSPPGRNARRTGTTKRQWRKTFEVSCASSAMNRCNWSGTTSA